MPRGVLGLEPQGILGLQLSRIVCHLCLLILGLRGILGLQLLGIVWCFGLSILGLEAFCCCICRVLFVSSCRVLFVLFVNSGTQEIFGTPAIGYCLVSLSVSFGHRGILGPQLLGIVCFFCLSISSL